MTCPALRADRNQEQADKEMTGDQSRTLRVGDRVCWGRTTTDLGTVVGTSWSEVPFLGMMEKQIQSLTTTWRKLSGCP
jgi:hypothetical protein